jgi:hypothetical protein
LVIGVQLRLASIKASNRVEFKGEEVVVVASGTEEEPRDAYLRLTQARLHAAGQALYQMLHQPSRRASEGVHGIYLPRDKLQGPCCTAKASVV